MKVPTRVIIHIACAFPLAAMFGVEARDVLPQTYGRHFTTWSWTLLLITLAAALVPIVDRGYWVPFLFLFTWSFGTVFEILPLLCAMTYRDPMVILAHASYGKFGIVYFGDKMLHTLPIFAVLGFVAVHRRGLCQALEHVNRSPWAPLAYLWFYVAPGLYVGLYALMHDLQKEYYSTLPVWIGAIVVIISLAITQSVLLFVFLRVKPTLL